MNLKRIYEGAAEDIADYKAKGKIFNDYFDKTEQSYENLMTAYPTQGAKEFEILGETYTIDVNMTGSYGTQKKFNIIISKDDGTPVVKLEDFDTKNDTRYVVNAFIIYFLTGEKYSRGVRHYEISEDLGEVMQNILKKGTAAGSEIIGKVFSAISLAFPELDKFISDSFETNNKNYDRQQGIGRAYQKRVYTGKLGKKEQDYDDAYKKAKQSIYDEAPAIEAGSTVTYKGNSGKQSAEVISIDDKAGKAKIKTERGATINVPLDKLEKIGVDYSALD